MNKIKLHRAHAQVISVFLRCISFWQHFQTRWPIGLLFFFFATLSHANLQIQIDPSQISLDETFRLTLTQDNPKQGANPDLSPLKKDFILLGSSRNESYSLINQQTQYTVSWTVFLKPRREGILTIPALKANGEQTSPLTLNVAAKLNVLEKASQNESPAKATKPVFLSTEVSHKKPFVNQQVIYTVKIYTAKQLLDANYEPPQVDNALVVPLPGRRYQTQKDSVPYLVEERSYAIFPQKSGPLEIIPPHFTALIYAFNPQRIQTKNQPLTLHVAPIPANTAAKTWLPAKEIQLSDSYEKTAKNLSQGDTLIRHITLKGIGLPAQLLPTLPFESTEAFSVYPEKGKDQNQVVQGDIVGQTQLKVTYLFNQSGSVTVPELSVTWFNTQTGQEQSTRLPPQTFHINPPAKNTAATPVEKTPNTATETSAVPLLTEANTLSVWPWFIAAFFAIAWLVTLFFWLKQKKSPTSPSMPSKKTLADLKKACVANNPQAAREALLQWAKGQWPDRSLLNLNDLLALIHDGSLKKEIRSLSEKLYQKDNLSAWHGEALRHCVQHFKTTIKAQTQPKEALPPLNPH